MNLGIDDDELAACVSCGLCLPHCPTYRVTGDESRSPRGRISAMPPAVHQIGLAAIDETISSNRWRRACSAEAVETACPSGVQFGHLIEATLAPRSSAMCRRTSRGGAAPATDCCATIDCCSPCRRWRRSASGCVSSRPNAWGCLGYRCASQSSLRPVIRPPTAVRCGSSPVV